MKKLFLLFLLLCNAVILNGQAKKSKQIDTIKQPKADTTIIDGLKESVLDNIPIVSVNENDFNDGSSQNISAALSASRDPFFSTAAFNFSALRFRIRGYEADHFSTYLNGVMLENLDNGFTPWGFLGGLNDVLRNREVVIGLNANNFAFGDIGTSLNIDARASKQRKQNTFSYAAANRNYNNRLMLTYNTGLLNKGWAFSFSGSRRWANEAYMPGTFFDSYSFFASADKVSKNQRHIFSFTAFAAPTQSGRQGAVLQESVNLSGNPFYNPFWGYDGKKIRNANVAQSFQPYIILSHELKINEVTTLNTALSYSKGERFTTGLDWYKAPDPRPDYYRYLPSFQTVPSLQQAVTTAIQNSANLQQLNWNKLYETNSVNIETIKNVNGVVGNNVSGLRSKYMVEERVINSSRTAFNMVLNTKVGEPIDLTIGINYQAQNNHYFKRVNDLLGGDFYVDWNQFAESFSPTTQALQNDLNRPNRLLAVGDKFGYDYNIKLRRAALWLQAVYKKESVDFFSTLEISNTQFSRTGNVVNGLFPSTSAGKSPLYNFTNIAAKAGATYKINGRNYLYANLAFITRPPYFDNVFISPRTRQDIQEQIQSEQIQTGEIGYLYNSPYLKFRGTVYATLMQRQMNILSFYHEEYRNFVNYAISNINKMYAGIELGVDIKLNTTLSLTAAAAISNNRFTSTQNAAITLDNDGSSLDKQQVYVQNFKVPGSPQQAYNIGLNYRSPKFWFISINTNYFREMWLDFNPLRRTDEAVAGIEYKSKLWNQIVDQTKLPNQFTMDLFMGYSFKLKKSFNKRPNFLIWNLGINNLLDNRTIRIGGYEQLRYDIATRNVNEFPPKFYYGYGINFFTSFSIRF